MTETDDPDPLALAVQQLAAARAVVRFEEQGVLRLAAQHPHDSDERVVVRLRPTDDDWPGAVVAGAALLVEDLRAVAARRSLRVVR